MDFFIEKLEQMSQIIPFLGGYPLWARLIIFICTLVGTLTLIIAYPKEKMESTAKAVSTNIVAGRDYIAGDQNVTTIINTPVTLIDKTLSIPKSIGAEPDTFKFDRDGVWVQKSFRIFNGTDKPVYALRLYLDLHGETPRNIQIDLFPEYQEMSRDHDYSSQRAFVVFPVAGEGKDIAITGLLITAYRLDPRQQLWFYIKAKAGMTADFTNIEWDTEEAGVSLTKPNDEQMILDAPLTSNLGDGKGKARISFKVDGMKVMLFKYKN